jgi:hypothetical protein
MTPKVPHDLTSLIPVVGGMLSLAMRLIQQYRETRDAIERATPGASGMLSDEALFALLERDAGALEQHAAALMEKWSAP